MDLAKIIAHLRLELRCLEAAIAAMEDIARVQNLPDAALLPDDVLAAEATVSEALPAAPGADVLPPVKRGRGRPRKFPGPTPSTAPPASPAPPEDL